MVIPAKLVRAGRLVCLRDLLVRKVIRQNLWHRSLNNPFIPILHRVNTIIVIVYLNNTIPLLLLIMDRTERTFHHRSRHRSLDRLLLQVVHISMLRVNVREEEEDMILVWIDAFESLLVVWLKNIIIVNLLQDRARIADLDKGEAKKLHCHSFYVKGFDDSLAKFAQK